MKQTMSEQKYGQARILVIDDDPLVTRTVQAYLKKTGFEDTESLNRSNQAIEKIELFQPDLILLDIFMPDVSGLELLQKIKSQPRFEQVIVLMLSSAEEKEKYRSLEMGAAGFIKKPVTAEISKHICRAFDVANRLGLLTKSKTERVEQVLADDTRETNCIGWSNS